MNRNGSFKVTRNDVDTLRFISESNRTLHNQRVRLELQVVIASVTLFVACLGFKLARPDLFPTSVLGAVWICAGFLLVAWVVFLFLRGSANANEHNQKAAMNAEDLLVELLRKEEAVVVSKSEDPAKANPITPGDVVVPITMERSLSGLRAAVVSWVTLGILDIYQWWKHQREESKEATVTSSSSHTGPPPEAAEDSLKRNVQDNRYNLNKWLWQARFVLATAIYSSVTILGLAAWPVDTADGTDNTRPTQSQTSQDELFDAAVDLMRASRDISEAKAALDELEKARITISKSQP